MYRICSTLLLTSCLVACGGQSNEEKLSSAQQKLIDAPSESIILAKNVLAEQPDNIEARLLLAQAELRIGSFASARKNFDDVYAVAKSQSALEGMLITATLLEEFNSALELLDQTHGPLTDQAAAFAINAALNLDRAEKADKLASTLSDLNSSYAALGLAFNAVAQNDVQRAQRLASQAIALDKNNADAHLLNAMLTERQGNFPAAYDAYESYRLLRPRDNRSLVLLTRSALLSNNLEKAEKYASEILGVYKTHPLANYAKAVFHYQNQQLEQVSEYSQYVVNDPRLGESARVLSAAASFRLGNYESALQSLQPLVGKLSRNEAGNNLLLALAAKLKDTALLEKMTQQVFQSSEKLSDEEILSATSVKFATSGETELSGQFLKELALSNPSSAYTHLSQGILAKLENNQSSALDSLERAYQADSENPQIAVLYIQSLLQAKQFDKADEVIKGATLSSPAFKSNLRMLSAIGKGSNAEARQLGLEALKHNNANPLSITLLVNASESQADIEQAKKALQGKEDLLTMLVGQLILQNKFELGASQILNENTFSPEHSAGLVSYLSQQEMHKELVGFVDGQAVLLKLPEQQKGEYLHALVATGEVDRFETTALRLIGSEPVSGSAFKMLERYYKGSGDSEKLTNLFAGVPEASYSLQQKETLVLSALQNKNINEAQRLLSLIDGEAHPDAVTGLQGAIAASSGDYKAAASHYIQAYRLNPTTRYAVNSIDSLLKSSQPRAAINLAKSHVEANPSDDTVKMMLATLVTGTEPESAMSLYASVDQSLMARNPVSLNNYAYLLANKGELEQARVYIEQALKLAPDNANIMDTKSMIDELSAKQG
ncbi:hypothetical protein DXV75_01735 [Alteromonas aestuariivivens]|uniref:PEP-CTERM system TPR-repeat protein PrsT n=1 Tax=Alteromonas aestuariivivens TaxID=1938339 RepID=A0A3D8MF06_9ALTE|nr:tetratricopeptide repeat protein [Alteromonas aestuariivivens]RDV29206.1 hypothetical protein DXV75_01735 [Alteromonas aestuariivivens]